jgi:hypothetical protein
MARGIDMTRKQGLDKSSRPQMGEKGMKLRITLLAAALAAAGPAFAQSATDNSAPKAPAHQPGVVAKPAPATPAAPTASSPAPTLAPAAKLDPAKDAAIRRLMDITETSKMGENIQAYITQQIQDVIGRAMAPDKAKKFMDTFSPKFNASSPPSAVTDAMVTIYAQNFSMEDIQGLIQFYETPLGQRVVKTMPEVSQQSQRAGVEMDQDAAITVLRGMTTEYPEIKQMLPPDESKAPEAAPAPSATPTPRTPPGPATPAAPKPAPQK